MSKVLDEFQSVKANSQSSSDDEDFVIKRPKNPRKRAREATISESGPSEKNF